MTCQELLCIIRFRSFCESTARSNHRSVERKTRTIDENEECLFSRWVLAHPDWFGCEIGNGSTITKL